LIISHKYKFIFIKTVKTAGTSIEVYLSPFCSKGDILTPMHPPEDNHVGRNYKGNKISIPMYDILYSFPSNHKKQFKRILNKGKYYSHIPALQIKSFVLKSIWNNYFKFCVERNPWDKVVSLYHMVNFNRTEKVSFKTFINRWKLQSNYNLYTSLTGNIIVDKIIKYDNLNEELTSVFTQLGIPFSGQLSVKAKSHYRKDKRNYRDYYNNNTKDIVGNKFKREIKLLGFEF